MASDQLVRSEIDAGLALVRALDKAAFGVKAALWLYAGDTETWRFVVATEAPKKDIERKYLDAANIVSRYRETDSNESILDLSRVRIVSSDDPLIRGLTLIIHADGLSEIRFSNNLINGVYVEDALIHRMAA